MLQGAFRQLSYPDHHDVGIREAWSGLLGLTGPIYMSAVVGAGETGEVPMEVDTLAVENQGSVNGEGESSKRCRDCVGVGFKGSGLSTKGLTAEARLLQVGGAVGTGVLWVAVMVG